DAALNNMSQGLCMFDANERIVVVNRRYLEMYGLSPEVVQPGLSLRELIQHRAAAGLLRVDPESHYRVILDDVARGNGRHVVSPNTDGRITEATNARMPGGGWVSTHEDVTDRERTQMQVSEQKFQLDAALNNMVQGLLMFGAQGRLVLANRRFREIYNVPAEALTPGTPLEDLIRLVTPLRRNGPE